MTLFKTITQGGQVNLHQLHMLKQVLMAGVLVALVGGGSYFAWNMSVLPSTDWRQAYERYWARFMLATTSDEKHRELTQLYVPPERVANEALPPQGISPKRRAYQRSVLSVLKDPLILRATRRVEKFAETTAYESLAVGAAALLVILGVWFVIGRGQRLAKHERGNTLVSGKILARIIRKRKKASDLRMGKLPLLKGKETSHILITGTTGSGKTNSFHILLPQIRKRRNRAIIVDVTGDYVSRYYNAKTDLILNPLDMRSLNWHPWADCHLDSHYDVLADAFIQPKGEERDPFWNAASRLVFKTALRKYAAHGNYDIEKLYAFFACESDKEFADFFVGTEAATECSTKNEKTSLSIRSVLKSHIEVLRQLDTIKRDPERNTFLKEESINPAYLKEEPCEINKGNQREKLFSIRDWVMDEKQQGWLFITARADQRKTLRPLISAWIDIAWNALMIMPENDKRRLWFVMDELAALQELPSLQMGLAEGRKYGGCLLAGFQSKPQLEEIYGRNAVESMFNLFNTKIFFRCLEPPTQEWISKVLGDKEEAEATENISFGANSMRDGVSLGRHTRQTPLVLPSELALLEDLECYVKYPGMLPSAKLKITYQPSSVINAISFFLKPEKQRLYGDNKVENLLEDVQDEETSKTIKELQG
ncbi:MAG: type IV secretion system DNA-binding domain-containing protein [Proteobacteria bacterium]|nr:type IV secretion system DNA-binding domain-containing protein [Pseudomonadota bacterium]